MGRWITAMTNVTEETPGALMVEESEMRMMAQDCGGIV